MSLWSEDYRPKTLGAYVWKDSALRTKVEEWIAAGEITGNVMFSGSPGTGKTSLAKLTLNLMGIPAGDILEINASRERKVDEIQAKVQAFVSTWPLKDMKYILFDECDSLSPLAQRSLRADLETFSGISRFIFTCNYPQRIIPALHSRLQTFVFETLDRDDYTARLGQILVAESVEFSVEALLAISDLVYPDLRKGINVMQASVINNVLQMPVPEAAETAKDYLIEMAELFKVGKLTEARKLLVANAPLEDYADIYRFFYRNLDMFGRDGATEEQKDEALLVLRKGIVYDSSAMLGDREINLSAVCVELAQIWRKTA